MTRALAVVIAAMLAMPGQAVMAAGTAGSAVTAESTADTADTVDTAEGTEDDGSDSAQEEKKAAEKDADSEKSEEEDAGKAADAQDSADGKDAEDNADGSGTSEESMTEDAAKDGDTSGKGASSEDAGKASEDTEGSEKDADGQLAEAEKDADAKDEKEDSVKAGEETAEKEETEAAKDAAVTETEDTDTKDTDTKAADADAADVQAAETKDTEVKAGEAKAAETKTTEAKASEEKTVTKEKTEEKKEAAKKTEASEKSTVIYNLGKLEVTVTTKGEEEDGFLHFEEDGSFVIPVTEDNPYFPYEVQFKYDDTVTTEWFLTPSDTVTVNGHEFGVSVGEDGDGNPVYSSLTLTVGGDEILVYPEKKSFTSPRVGLLKAMSLQPLKEVRLNLGDALKNYTPVELTQVSADMLFEGGQVTDEDRIIWTHIDDDLGENYTISQKGSILDLSFDLDYSSISRWEMIVGKPDQLAKDNVRYIVSFNLPGSPYIRKWLDAVLLVDGKEHQPDDFYYYDYTRESRELYIRTTAAVTGDSKSANVRLSVNPSIYPTPNYAKLRVFDGSYTDAAEAAGGTDITGQLMGTGYTVSRSSDQDITFVTYDADGNATGCLPVRILIISGNGRPQERSML